MLFSGRCVLGVGGSEFHFGSDESEAPVGRFQGKCLGKSRVQARSELQVKREGTVASMRQWKP